jgi:hypothetical protein
MRSLTATILAAGTTTSKSRASFAFAWLRWTNRARAAGRALLRASWAARRW